MKSKLNKVKKILKEKTEKKPVSPNLNNTQFELARQMREPLGMTQEKVSQMYGPGGSF